MLNDLRKYEPIKKALKTVGLSAFIFKMLSCQGSNLDSSDPESDVLPITPQDNFLLLTVDPPGLEPGLF